MSQAKWVEKLRPIVFECMNFQKLDNRSTVFFHFIHSDAQLCNTFGLDMGLGLARLLQLFRNSESEVKLSAIELFSLFDD